MQGQTQPAPPPVTQPTGSQPIGQEAHTEQALLQALAHDLRAPVRSVDSFAGLLTQHLQQAGHLDDTAQDHLRRIRDAATRMSGLMDNLQELMSASRAPLRDEPVDLSLLADWAAAELQDASPDREARIQVIPGLATQGDPHYLKRMLARLLENAWRFTPAEQPVAVTVEGERIGDRLHLRVRDHGIGFDMRYASNLFEPFQRLHGPEQGAGSGLGLAIAQCIARRHGGTIRAESTLADSDWPQADAAQGNAASGTAASGSAASGSVFHIELPLRAEVPQVDALQDASQPDASPIKPEATSG